MLQITDAYLRRGDRDLFSGLSFTIHAGQKVGIVGRNGAGKSTLFQLIKGNLSLEAGELMLPRDWRIGHLAQEIATSQRPAVEWIIDGHTALRKIEAKLEAAETADDTQALAELHGQFDDIGGYQVQTQARQILAGLGFKAAEFDQPFQTFSGGWRIRLALARALLQPSELLLLDEPTNHLDMETSLWLEQWLQRYPGTALTIAHDRAFLDATTDYTLHIQGGQSTLYKGNYSIFEQQRALQLAAATATREKQSAQRAHIEQFVDRFRAKASKAKQVQSRLRALEKMQQLGPIYADSPYQVQFTEPAALPSPLLAISHLNLGYQDQVLLKNINESILPGDRIGILGQNGAGKSTLLKALVGDLNPLSGSIHAGRGLRCGYFAQHQLETLDVAASALAVCQRQTQYNAQQSRNYLGRWGFSGTMVERAINTLSGGEKSRLVIALLANTAPNLLVLDEPTNHLDLDMREALALALQAFPGALVIVSHDRALLERTVDRFWLVQQGRVQRHEGDLEDYRHNLEPTDGTPSKPATNKRKSRRQQTAAARSSLAPLRKRVKDLDTRMAKETEELKTLEGRLADPDVYSSLPTEELDKLLKKAGALRQQLEATEMDWLDATAALEADFSDA